MTHPGFTRRSGSPARQVNTVGLESPTYCLAGVITGLALRRLWYTQDTADASSRPPLDLIVARHRRLGQVRGIHPDIVFGAVMVQDTAVLPQMPFELSAVHGPVSPEFLGCGWTQAAHQSSP